MPELLNILHQDKQPRKSCGSLELSAIGASSRGLRQVHDFIYTELFLSATCSVICFASLQNHSRVALWCYGISSSFSLGFYALISPGMLSLNSQEKPLAAASQSCPLPWVPVGSGVSSQTAPALSSAAGLRQVALQPAASVSPAEKKKKGSTEPVETG